MRKQTNLIFSIIFLIMSCPFALSQPDPLIDGGLFYNPLSQALITVGGWGNPTWEPVKTVWSLSGAGWVSLPSLPTGITHTGGVYDSSLKRFVVLGGAFESQSTYAFDGVAWTKIADPVKTSMTGGDPEMIYDPELKKIIMYFAGFGPGTATSAETYFLEPEGWVKQTLAAAPPAGADTCFVYDSAHKEGVWFNGEQMWTWNHTQWAKKTPASKPDVSAGFFNMVYDSARNVTVLFGKGQTWSWDGTNWNNISSANSPAYPNRGFFAMGFDEKRQITVLWGGELQTDPKYPNDIWEWDGVAWKPFTATPVPEWVQY